MYIHVDLKLVLLFVLPCIYITQQSFMNQYSGTKQKSPRRLRTLNGQFEPDNAEEIKRLRSIRLTDTAWEKLAEIAEKNQITRTEVIEIFARGEELD